MQGAQEWLTGNPRTMLSSDPHCYNRYNQERTRSDAERMLPVVEYLLEARADTEALCLVATFHATASYMC